MLWKPSKPALWPVFCFYDSPSGANKIPNNRGCFWVTESFLNGERTSMPRLATPLSNLKCRTAKPRDRAYKLFDGGSMYLYVMSCGSKTWRLQQQSFGGLLQANCRPRNKSQARMVHDPLANFFSIWSCSCPQFFQFWSSSLYCLESTTRGRSSAMSAGSIEKMYWSACWMIMRRIV